MKGSGIHQKSDSTRPISERQARPFLGRKSRRGNQTLHRGMWRVELSLLTAGQPAGEIANEKK
jgi:hypothetical protein